MLHQWWHHIKFRQCMVKIYMRFSARIWPKLPGCQIIIATYLGKLIKNSRCWISELTKYYTTIWLTGWWQVAKFPDGHQTHHLLATWLTAVHQFKLAHSWVEHQHQVHSKHTDHLTMKLWYLINFMVWVRHGIYNPYRNLKYVFIASKFHY